MRWPGSWHRKGQPKLASIVEYNPDGEIDLRAAGGRLKEARRETANQPGGSPAPQPEIPGDGRDTADLIAAILRAGDYHDPIARLAMRYLKAGMPDSQVVLTLRGTMLAVDPGRRDYKDGILHKDRWRSRYDDIPRAVSSARAKIRDGEQPPSNKPDNRGWSEPAKLLGTQIEAPPTFPATFLPGPFSDLACDIADRMQCPLDFPAVPLIISAATAIGKYFRLAPKAQDDWTERPCLWGGLVSDVSAQKSPAINEGLVPFRWLLQEIKNQHDRELEEHTEALVRADFAEKRWKAACRKAAKEGAEMPEKPRGPGPPHHRRMMTDDATQENLVRMMSENPRGLLLFRDELSGWFASFNQYRPGADRQFFLECHAGGSYYKDREAGHFYIDELYLNILGGLQPATIKKVLACGEVDGMTARFSLVVWPERDPEFLYVDRPPNLGARRKCEGIIKRLSELQPEAFFGSKEPGIVRALRFDDEAQAIFVNWYTTNQQRIRGNENPAFLAHLGKYAGLFARLAIGHHLIRHVVGDTASPVLVDAITAGTVQTFIDEYLEPHARRIYRHLGADPARQGAQRIAQWLFESREITQFTARDIRQKDWSGLTSQEDVNRALDYLENNASWIRCTDAATTARGGRPTSRYLINPFIRS